MRSLGLGHTSAFGRNREPTVLYHSNGIDEGTGMYLIIQELPKLGEAVWEEMGVGRRTRGCSPRE